MEGGKEGWMEGQTEGRKHGRTDGRKAGWTQRWKGGWTEDRNEVKKGGQKKRDKRTEGDSRVGRKDRRGTVEATGPAPPPPPPWWPQSAVVTRSHLWPPHGKGPPVARSCRAPAHGCHRGRTKDSGVGRRRPWTAARGWSGWPRGVTMPQHGPTKPTPAPARHPRDVAAALSPAMAACGFASLEGVTALKHRAGHACVPRGGSTCPHCSFPWPVTIPSLCPSTGTWPPQAREILGSASLR